MQIFSYLQRKINDKDYIALGLIWLALFVWGAVSKVFPYMPPMFGFLIAVAIVVKNREYIFGIFAYFLFFEADRGYFLFSTWLYFYIHVNYIIPLISSFVDCKRCMLVISVALSYLLYYLMIFFLGMLFLAQTHFFNPYPIMLYAVIETLLILIVGDIER